MLVNLARIKEIKPYFKSGFLLIMADAAATEIVVSERQAKPFRQRIPGPVTVARSEIPRPAEILRPPVFALSAASQTPVPSRLEGNMKILRSAICMAALMFGVLYAQESAKVTGTWKLALDTPHGQMPGALQLKQDGGKLTGSVDVEHMGSMPLVGQVEGDKLSFTIEIQGNQKITFNGTVAGDKIIGLHGTGRKLVGNPRRDSHLGRTMTMHRILFGAAVFAAALAAQSQKTVAGTVTEFKPLEIGIKTDAAEAASHQVRTRHAGGDGRARASATWRRPSRPRSPTSCSATASWRPTSRGLPRRGAWC